MMATQVRHKELRFPVDVACDEGRRTTAKVSGKHHLRIATPPVFGGNDPELRSPEDTFVAVTASCLVTASLDLPVRTETLVSSVA